MTRMHFEVAEGKLVVRGQGLRPKVAIEALDFEDAKGITKMKFHGLGLWKPIVATFGGIYHCRRREVELRADVPSVMKGDVKTTRERPGSGLPAPEDAASGADAEALASRATSHASAVLHGSVGGGSSASRQK